MSFPQRCKMCGRRDKLGFHVADEIWAAVIPEPMQGFVACLLCFDALAAQKDVDYAPALGRKLWFDGDAVSFDLKISKSVSRRGPG